MNSANKKQVLVLVHRIFSGNTVKKGGADHIVNYFQEHGCLTFIVEHPLSGRGGSRMSKDGKDLFSETFLPNGFARWFLELPLNIFLKYRYQINPQIILAVDPLNFLSAFVIRFLSFGPVKPYIHFHSIDYSEERFKYSWANYIYSYFYIFALNNADLITYVSKPMGELIKQKVGNGKFESKKYFYFPNSPDRKRLIPVPINERSNYLVYSKAYISDYEYRGLLSMLDKIKETVPQCQLVLIGNVDIKEPNVSIKTYGLLPYEQNISIVREAFIGIAWYENKKSFEKYADSLKLREYAALGIPAICNSKISTALEMYEEGAGLLTESFSDMAEKVVLLYRDKTLYKSLSTSALAWARKTDKEELLNQIYKEIL